MKPLLVFGALKECIHFFETPGIYNLTNLIIKFRDIVIRWTSFASKFQWNVVTDLMNLYYFGLARFAVLGKK
jgi:hypothetical protein